MKNPCLINNKRDTMLTEKSKRYLVVGVVAAILLAIIVVFVIFEKERVAEIIQTGQQANPQTEPAGTDNGENGSTDDSTSSPIEGNKSSLGDTLNVDAYYFMDETPPRVRFEFINLEIDQKVGIHPGGAGGPLYNPEFPIHDVRRYVGGWPHDYDIKISNAFEEYSSFPDAIPSYVAQASEGWIDLLMYMPGTYGFEVTSQEHARVEFEPVDFKYWHPHTKYEENEFIIYLEDITNDNEKFFNDAAYVKAALYDSQGNPITINNNALVSFSGGHAYAYVTTENKITVKFTPVLNTEINEYSLESQWFNREELYNDLKLKTEITHEYYAENESDYKIWMALGTENGQSAVWKIILNYQVPPEKDPIDEKEEEEETTTKLTTPWANTNTPIGSTSIVYTGSKFVGVHTGGVQISTSNTGASWSSVSNAPTGLQQVTYGDGKVVAVGPGKSAVSNDGGLTWTEHSQSNFPTRWSDVFFGGGKFVAINDALVGEIALFVSEDGITWQDKTSTLPLNSYSSTFRPRRGVYGNNMYVIIGGVDIAYSQNLNSWQLGGKEWNTEKMGITFGSGKFTIVTRTKTGSNYPGNTGNIMTSTNGNDWTVHTTPNDGNMQFHTGVISYGGGKFVAIGSDAGAHGKIGPNVIYSSDGINWYLENIYNYQIRDIAFGNNRFVTTSGHLRSY